MTSGSGVMVGGSFPTTTSNLSVAVIPSWSVTVTVTVARPARLSAGVTVTVRFAPDFPNATWSGGRSSWSDVSAESFNCSTGVSRSPIVNPTGPAGTPTRVG